MDRILKQTSSEIRVTLYSAGVAIDAAANPTVTITRDSTGAALVTNAATTKLAATTGIYTYTLTPAQTATVDILTATWTATISGVAGQLFTTAVEIVGGFIATLAAIDTATPGTQTTDQLTDARDYAESALEEACGIAFRERYRRELGPDESVILSAPDVRSLISVRQSGALLSSLTGISVTPYGAIDGLTGSATTDVAYSYGLTDVPPRVENAVIRLARSYLLPDPANLDERATSISTEDATYSLVTAGVFGAAFSIPEVNQVVQQYRRIPVG